MGKTDDAPEGGDLRRVASKAAHDIYNLLTIVYGVQDEIQLLPEDGVRKPLLRGATKTVAEKLGEIAARLRAVGERPEAAEGAGR